MYDIIIIGAGPGGYVAAERAGAEGKKVLLIEKHKLGGVCLHRGCIPAKSLLHSAKLYRHAVEGEQFGVEIKDAVFNLQKAMAWKARTVNSLEKGVEYLMKKNNVAVISGEAELKPGKQVTVNRETYQAGSIIIATGSSTAIPPIAGADKKHVLTSREILEMEKLPESITVIGGGVIGMEFASFFSMLDVKVTVIEMMPEILPEMDAEVSKTMRSCMKTIDFHTGCRVTEITDSEVLFEKDGTKSTVKSELVLMAAGRKANTDLKGLKECGIDFTDKGIWVNEQMKTNIPDIYAVGDVTGKSMLAHSASRMGEVALNTICGKKDRMRYDHVPWVVYTSPEAAGCGLSEKKADDLKLDFRVKKYNFAANGRFLAENGKQPGFCKALINSADSTVLGIHLIGPGASELIASAAVIMEAELRENEIREIIFAHPTVSETVREVFF